jgi:hypothetical protein
MTLLPPACCGAVVAVIAANWLDLVGHRGNRAAAYVATAVAAAGVATSMRALRQVNEFVVAGGLLLSILNCCFALASLLTALLA